MYHVSWIIPYIHTQVFIVNFFVPEPETHNRFTPPQGTSEKQLDYALQSGIPSPIIASRLFLDARDLALMRHDMRQPGGTDIK